MARRPCLRAGYCPGLALRLIGCRLARFNDANPVIGELAVGSGQIDLRHVTRGALLLTYRTGRS